MTSSSRFDTDQQRGGDSVLGRGTQHRYTIYYQGMSVSGTWRMPNNGAESPKRMDSTDAHKKACCLTWLRSPAPQLDHTESKNCLTPVFNYQPSVLAGSVETYPETGRSQERHIFENACSVGNLRWGQNNNSHKPWKKGQKPPSPLNLQERSLCWRWVGTWQQA